MAWRCHLPALQCHNSAVYTGERACRSIMHLQPRSTRQLTTTCNRSLQAHTTSLTATSP